MSPEILSLIAMVIGLAIMMYLACRGMSLLLIGPVVSVFVLLLSGMPVIENMTGTYSVSVSNFVKNNFLMILTASIFGSILGEAGAAEDIAWALTSKIDTFKKGDKQFIALMILSVIFALLVYGGVSGFVVVFTMVPLCKRVFKQYDIPWHLYLAIHSLGANLFAQVMLPGSPAVQNLMPMEYLGTTPMAAPWMGIGTAVYSIILAVIYIRIVLTRCQKAGETFMDTGAAINETIEAEDRVAGETKKVHGSFWKAVIAPVFVLILLNVVSINASAALTAGTLLCVALYFKRFRNVIKSLGIGAKNGANTTILIAAIVGFGGIVKAAPGYTLLTESLAKMPGSPLIQFVIAVNAVAAISGSSSGGESIALETFGTKFVEMGFPPEVIHRIAAIACQGLDSLPHAGGVINQIETARLTFKNYIHIFVISALIPFTAGFFAIFLYSIGII